MNQIPFNIEKAKSGAKVVTRDGMPVKLLGFDFHCFSGEPIVGIYQFKNVDMLACWHANGAFTGLNPDPFDLFLSVEPQFRAWNSPDEVPMPCTLRAKACPTSRWTVLSVSKYGVGTSDCIGVRNDVGVTTFELLFRHNEFSIDGGRSWEICGVQI